MYAVDESGQKLIDRNEYGAGGLEIFAGLKVANTFQRGVGIASSIDETILGIVAHASQTASIIAALSSSFAFLFEVAANGVTNVWARDAVTNSNTTVLRLHHDTSGTPATGFGGQIDLNLQTSTTEDITAAQILWTWTTATHASRKGQLTLYATDDTGSRAGLAVDTDGSGANITLFGIGSYGSGRNVVFVANAAVNPSANPTGGGILYSDAGAGKWRGSSGTTTTFGPAEPHCPVCGTDFVFEWENPEYGYLSVCMRCLARELGRRRWIVRKKPAKG